MSRVSCTVTHSDQRVDEFEADPEQQAASDEQANPTEHSLSEPDPVREKGERRGERRRALRRADGSFLKQSLKTDVAALKRAAKLKPQLSRSARKRSQQEILETVLLTAAGVALVGFFAVGALGEDTAIVRSGSFGASPAAAHPAPGASSESVAHKLPALMQTAQAIAVVAAPPRPAKPAKPASAGDITGGQEVSETLPVQAAALSTPSAPKAEEQALAIAKSETTGTQQVALLSPAELPKPKAKLADAPPAQAPDRAANVLQQGHDLMAKGDVTAARVLFVQGMEFGSPEAALALGRSFDPEFLGRVPNANAEPDAGRAEAMYREWHRRSLAAGSVAPGVKLSKLIQAMRRQ